MQTPDANGYVNVQWPSKTIPHGGLFHTRIVEPTAAQQQFLKVLLEEQKLSIAQRQKAPWALRQPDEPKESRRPALQVPTVRPHTSRRRSLSAIRESGVFELDPYQPMKRGEDRELLKARLANSMEHGDTPEQQPPPPPRVPKPKPKLPTDKERRNELLTQIRERAEWLAEMEDLGHAGAHRDIVHDQIAERMRALDALGIDSQCSTARSTDSGFSTTGEIVKMGTGRSQGSAAKSVKSNRSTGSREKQKSTRSSARGCTKKEENVFAYNNVPLLQYSPRRRV
ncbi:hypothetical protein MSG28_003895 [Choristoneura fumiferana]|uniref:Uncharacterized protein n=2 Tax=Choristoneura fumiferana TaxID=7141 RepID=A0ACC0KGN3_CHOFU|nr:hypothetical protein MSG28_003895 [Choristoneura fumiferana]KAI8435630.1 hypothetical protein MSG28_003895 [Choristoneura fumiferana]